MKLPKFLMADNSDYPDDLFVVHTEYPRFILSIEDEEVEWLDIIDSEDDASAANDLTALVEEAFKFCESEIEKYEGEDF